MPARVLFLTSSPERAVVMQQTAASFVMPHLDISPDLFLFSGDPTSQHPLDAAHLNAAGAAVLLVPAQPATVTQPTGEEVR